jgi:aspartyl protease family protein
MDLKLPLAAVLLTGAATGLLLPVVSSVGQPEQPRVLDAAMPAAPRGATAVPDAWAENVVLTRAVDGHFYADVAVDGVSLHMLVDTGASVVALTGADAEALGLTWDPAQVAPVAQGASGAVEGVNLVIPAMTLGDHEARNVPALVIPEGLEVSLLGQSFLSTLGQVQMSGEHMLLGNGEN